ncbi:MAG: protein kinase domain-containing protein [Planctomycetota bacterium]
MTPGNQGVPSAHQAEIDFQTLQPSPNNDDLLSERSGTPSASNDPPEVWETQSSEADDLYKTQAYDGTKPQVDRKSQDRYQKLHLHKQGGLGQVFIAVDQELSREIALKEIREQHAHDLESRLRFVREAEITGRLEHPGIVPVYGFGTHDDGRPYYAMRFIRGDSLEDAIHRFHATSSTQSQGVQSRVVKNLAFRDLIKRLIDACHAIHYAHSRGILHRDIKPANIMLGRYGETLVVDWGLAKVTGDSKVDSAQAGVSVLKLQSSGNSTPTMMGSAFGTPGYMSPEQSKGQIDKLSPASDVFSLGATLYHLLTGHRPLKHLKTISEIHQAVCRGDIASPKTIEPSIDSAIDAVCRKAMHIDPNARYLSALEMATDLDRYLADAPVKAYAEPFRLRCHRWIRRNTAMAVFGLATLLVGLAAAATIAWINGSRNQELKSSNLRMQLANDRAIAEAKAAREAEALAKNREETARILAEDKEELAREKAAAATEAAEIANFLLDLFQASDPVRQGNKEFRGKPMSLQLTARDLLDRGAEQLRGGGVLQTADRSRAKLMGSIGDVYRQLSLFDEAEPLLVESVSIYEKAEDTDPSSLADSYHKLAQLQHEQGDYLRGLENYRKALALREKLSGDAGRAQVANTFHNIGWLLANMGENEEAQEFLEKAAKLRSELPDYGPSHRETLFSQIGIAFCLIEQKKWAEALPIVVDAATKLKSIDDNKNMTNAILCFAKGVIYRNNISAKLAEQELRKTVGLVASELGTEGIYYALAQYELANALLDQKLDQEAMELMNNCILISRRTVHMKHPRIRILLDSYSRLLIKNDRTREAVDLWNEFLTAQETRFGDRDRFTYENLASYVRFQRRIADDAGALESISKIEGGIDAVEFDLKNRILAFALREHASILNEQNTNVDLAINLGTRALQLYKDDANPGAEGLYERFLAHTTLARAYQRASQAERGFELLNAAEKLIPKLSPRDHLSAKDDLQLERADLFLLQGELEKAILCCETRLEYAKTDPTSLLSIAVGFVACGKLAQRIEAAASIVDSCFTQAIAALDKALEKGVLSNETLLRSDKFEPLRDREDFKNLLDRKSSN